MLTYSTYKLIHIFALFLVLSGIAGVWALKAASGSQDYQRTRKLLMSIHGIAMFFILLGGFGTLARLGISFPWPLWIWIKLTIWIALAALPVVLSRASGASKVLFLVAPVLAAVAAWAAINQVGG